MDGEEHNDPNTQQQEPDAAADQNPDQMAEPTSNAGPMQRESSMMPSTAAGQVQGLSMQQNDLQFIGEDVNGEEKKEVIPPEILEDMQNIWSVFDLERKDQVSIIELRTILRALDFDPSDDELDFLTKQIDPEGFGFFTFSRLRDVMEEKLKDKDTIEDLMEQLKKLDRDKDGKIPNPEFKQFLMNMGSKMNLEQAEEFMKEADPKGDGAVDIEELAQRLCPPKK